MVGYPRTTRDLTKPTTNMPSSKYSNVLTSYQSISIPFNDHTLDRDFKQYLASSPSTSQLAPDILPTSTAHSSFLQHFTPENIEPNLETKIPKAIQPT